MICRSCGSQLPAKARFCTSCGAPVIPEAGSSRDVDNHGFVNRFGERIDLPQPTVSDRGRGQTGMEYQLIGTTLQAVILELDPDEVVYSESGAMAWMSGNIVMNTSGRGGGIGGFFKRAFSGESLFLVEYASQGGKGIVAFAADFPGKIIPIHLGPGQEIIAQKQSFLCAERTVDMTIFFNRRLGSGFFGGEGFIMQKFTGPGIVFAELDGEIMEYTLEAGQVLKVDTGHVAMFEPTVHFDIEMVKGFRNILFGGEGLFLSTLRGPGRVWLQTMPMLKLAQAIARYVPGGGDNNSGGGGINIRLGD